MTSKKKMALVLEGREIKLRLQADQAKNTEAVHIDWLRFTVQRKNAPIPDLSNVFADASWGADYESVSRGWDSEHVQLRDKQRLTVRNRICLLLRDLPDSDYAPSTQAYDLADRVASILGADFAVAPELKKGQDFYRFRWSIVRAGVECAWVGFLVNGNSRAQQRQAQTLHVNLHGTACTFAAPGWRKKMAALIEELEAKITRIDLALDFFDGIAGGLDRIRDDWHAGLMDVRGRTPAVNTVGPWVEGGRGRSFYFGSREAGKQTNVYEKGVQLFGLKDATRWERVELRYGNKLRELPVDALRRPDSFFAGASDWHAAILAEHGKAATVGEKIKVKARQAIETVQAEVTRSVRWLTDTASQSLALAFHYLDEESFLSLVTGRNLPGRLQKFKTSEISAAFDRLAPSVLQPWAVAQ